MIDEAARSREQLQRELEFYRREVDTLGARLLRLQEDQSRASREARRSKIVARLVRDAYQIVHEDILAHKIGGLILTKVADAALCDRAAFLLRDPTKPNMFLVEHAYGGEPGTHVDLGTPPEFLFTATGHTAEPQAAKLIELIGLPFILWAYDAENNRGLLLGKPFEGNIHRPYEERDREIAEVTLAVYIDVLLRKTAEATMRQAKQAAENASNARSRFLANLSHELRSPLNTIIGFSGLLLESGSRTSTPENREEFTRQIQAAGRSLLALANDILDFSSLGHAKLQLRRDWVPLGQMLHGVARALSAESAKRHIKIELTPIPPTLQASIDYDRFRQILTNLIGNAIKFSLPSSRIIISATLTETEGAHITIRDYGIGIHPTDISRAMEPFVQIKTGTDDHPSGAGLGLPIAKQLIEAHDGTLILNSIPGEGTTVTIQLPPKSARLATREQDNDEPNTMSTIRGT